MKRTRVQGSPQVKRTYSGQSRSFLVSLNNEDSVSEPESYSALRLRWGVDPPDYDLSNTVNPLKSITELRSKGETRRFLDQAGYLLEGMDPSNSTALKRSSAFDITAQLCDPDFARKAKAADFYHKTWYVFLKAGAGTGQDKILDILLIFFLALVARNTDILLDLVSQNHHTRREKQNPAPDLIHILFFLLRTTADIDPLSLVSSSIATDLDFQRIGLSKKDRLTLSTIHSTISTKSNLVSSEIPVTSPLLITNILTLLPSSLLRPEHLSDLLHSLRSLINASFPPHQPFTSHYHVFELFSDDDDDKGPGLPQYECITRHLHLLDRYLLGSSSSTTELDKVRDEWFVDGLMAVGVGSDMILRRRTSSMPSLNDSASECLNILLRVLVNLTHSDSNWAQSVIASDFAIAFIMRLIVTSSPEGEESQHKLEHDDVPPPAASSHHQQNAWDRLCLALGLLTNLVQSVPGFKNVLHRTKVSIKCTLSNLACAKKCKCPSSSQIGALEVLVGVYNTHSRLLSSKAPPPPPSSSSKLVKLPSLVQMSKPSMTAVEGNNDTSTRTTSLILSTLSILFGILMSSSRNRSIILSLIEDGDDGDQRIKLERLVRQAKEFVFLYDDDDDDEEEEEEDMGSISGGGGGGREMRNVKEVVSVLERLRDECR